MKKKIKKELPEEEAKKIISNPHATSEDKAKLSQDQQDEWKDKHLPDLGF